MSSMLTCTHGDIISPISLCTLLHSCSLKFDLLQSKYDDVALKDLQNVVPNIRHSTMQSYEVWSELDA